jgi:hypothetical protein
MIPAHSIVFQITKCKAAWWYKTMQRYLNPGNKSSRVPVCDLDFNSLIQFSDLQKKKIQKNHRSPQA